MKVLLDKNDIVFMDVYSYILFNEGFILMGVKKVLFRYNNFEDFECKLKVFCKCCKIVWIFVEGVYFMYGDIVDLK